MADFTAPQKPETASGFLGKCMGSLGNQGLRMPPDFGKAAAVAKTFPAHPGSIPLPKWNRALSVSA
jgi:hypothetical protein